MFVPTFQMCDLDGFEQCHNPNLGLVTKARTWKGAGQECNPRVTFTLIGV
jgi:hypothetical protein